MLLTHPWPIARPFIAGGVHTISLESSGLSEEMSEPAACPRPPPSPRFRAFSGVRREIRACAGAFERSPPQTRIDRRYAPFPRLGVSVGLAFPQRREGPNFRPSRKGRGGVRPDDIQGV